MGNMEVPRLVLLLEPEILIRMVVAQYLRECGYTVIEGAAAADFHTLLESGCQPHIVLADVNLSDGPTGFELAQSVRQTHAEIDVILTSGISRVAEQAHDLCHEGPIRKPYHPKDVEARIKVLLKRRLEAKRR
jgi:DNA-binding response OmpR family regulator